MMDHYNWESVLGNPHFKKMQEVLNDRLGFEAGSIMIGMIRKRTEHLFSAEMQETETDRDELYGYILPSIAAYTILCELLGSEKALDMFRSFYLSVAYNGAKKLREMAQDQDFLFHFPHQMAENKSKQPTNSGGFIFQLIRDDQTGSEFHVLKCPYYEYSLKYGCQELVSTFCDCDDICYGNIHPKLKWNRTETIDRGDPLCDFRFDWDI